MHKKELTGRRGLALIELMVATAIVTIPILVIGMILTDSQRGWNTM